MIPFGATLFQGIYQTLNQPLFQVGRENVSLLWLLEVMVLLLLVTLLARGIKRFLKRYLLLRLGVGEGSREVIGTLSSLSLGTLGYILVLQAMGLDFTSLAVVLGGLGIGIGFGLQELTKNLVSGLTLLGENKLKVGDLIEFNGNLGRIQEISIRSTVIRTFQGSELVVPNTDLTSNAIENWSYENCQGRIEIPISVDYGSDLLLVTETLLESAFLEKEVLETPPPKVIFQGFGDSDLHFELWVWVDNIERRLFIKSSLNFIVEHQFRQRGIKIPFPQRELWLRNIDEVVTSMRGEKSDSLLSSDPPPPPRLKELLQQFKGFAGLNDLQIRGLIEMGKRRQLMAGETFIRQGEYGDSFCIVLSGEMEAIYENQNYSHHRLFTFKAGEYFGELPLMLGVPYPTTMKAITDVTLFLIGKNCFQKLLNQCSHLAEDVANELAKRQDAIQDYQAQLKAMGLLAEEDLTNPVEWIRKRFLKIFSLNY